MGVFADQEKEKKKKDESTAAQSEKETVQRSLSDVNGPEGGMLPESVSARIQSKRGTGQKLSDRSLQQYSQKFGRDMSDVHIHTDSESDTISRSLNARAFTIGSDVFLTKGINPDGGGRDAQTMTHELTHVVQQGGHAGSGPLKLGAADTSQEHEAESTAQREFFPEVSEENTIQRGFLGDLGTMIGHNMLNMVGMEDAYNATFGAKHRVQDAVSQMDEGDADLFRSNEEKISEKEQDLDAIKAEIQGAEEGPERDSLMEEYASTSSSLSTLRESQLKAVQKIDPSISDSDMIQYRNKHSGRSMVLSKLGGSIMAGFARSGQKGQARARGMQAGANFGAGSAAYTPAKPAEEASSSGAQIQELQQEVQALKKQLASLLPAKEESGK